MFSNLLVFIVFVTTMGSTVGGPALIDQPDFMPPFEAQGEEPVDDPAFARECENAIEVYLASEPDMRVVRRRISLNAGFGPVCRADFETPDDGEDSVNRMMFWRRTSGELVEFVGFDIPAAPLE